MTTIKVDGMGRVTGNGTGYGYGGDGYGGYGTGYVGTAHGGYGYGYGYSNGDTSHNTDTSFHNVPFARRADDPMEALTTL